MQNEVTLILEEYSEEEQVWVIVTRTGRILKCPSREKLWAFILHVNIGSEFSHDVLLMTGRGGA